VWLDVDDGVTLECDGWGRGGNVFNGSLISFQVEEEEEEEEEGDAERISVPRMKEE